MSLDDNQDLDPSADPNLDETAATPSQEQQPDAAVSSPATGENEDKDLLSVVRDVVKETREKSDPASPAEGENEETGQAPKKDDDENFTDVPFHKHPRFQHLLRERNTFKQDAQRYQNVENFLDTVGLTAEEAADGMTIMGLAKTDPAEAWKQIKPWVQKLLIASGEALPEDLRTRVQNGEMSQEAALELSRAKARNEAATAAQSFREQQATRREATDLSNSLRQTAQDWTRDRYAKDPNFANKETAVLKEVLFLQQTEGRPKSPEGVTDQLQRAYKAVNSALKPAAPAAPARTAIRPVTGGKVAGHQQAEPESMLDIVRANRRAR